MPRSRTVAERTYQPGTYVVELNNIPTSNTAGFRLVFTRTSSLRQMALGGADIAAVLVELSEDGGATWRERKSSSGSIPVGPVLKPRTSDEALESVVPCYWRGVADGQGGRRAVPSTDIRLTMTVRAAFTTAITIEAI